MVAPPIGTLSYTISNPGGIKKLKAIRRILHTFIATTIISVLTAGISIGQTTTSSASATEITVTSSTPSSYRIQANILAQKKAAIQAQIDIAQRCITTNSNSIISRDSDGNTRTVPKTDVTICTRRLNDLKRQLASLTRQSARLISDASAASIRLQSQQQRTAASSRLQGKPNQ